MTASPELLARLLAERFRHHRLDLSGMSDAAWLAARGVRVVAPEEVVVRRELVAFKRNTRISDSNSFKGDWVAVPFDDFCNLRTALAAGETT